MHKDKNIDTAYEYILLTLKNMDPLPYPPSMFQVHYPTSRQMTLELLSMLGTSDDPDRYSPARGVLFRGIEHGC